MGTADQAGGPPPVLAEAAVSSGGYRLRWSAEWVRERFRVIPAVNQDATAVLVIDSLEDVLLQIARCPRQSGCYTDRDGTVRLVKPLPDWEDCLDLAFTEITTYGASSPQAARRLLAAYATLEAAAGPARRAAVAARREELSRLIAAGGLARQALRADPMGLG
jgi:uncharacterized membrane protein